MGHLLTENRNGIVVDVRVTQAHRERRARTAVEMLSGKSAARRRIVRADISYDTPVS